MATNQFITITAIIKYLFINYFIIQLVIKTFIIIKKIITIEWVVRGQYQREHFILKIKHILILFNRNVYHHN